MPFKTLELLSDPETAPNAPPPFELLCRENCESSDIIVSTANSILAIARSPCTIDFFNLNVPDEKSSITLPLLPHSAMLDPVIFAIKLLCDGSILLVRGDDGHSAELSLHAIEAYAIPEWKSTSVSPAPLQCNYVQSNQKNYYISAMYTRQATSDNPSEEEIIKAQGYLPTVTISVESAHPIKGITQYRLYPMYVPEEEPRFRYQWPMNVWQGHYSEHDQ